MTILKYTDDAVIIGNIAADADSENYLHLGEIKSSVQLQWLTAKPNQDKCDAFHHPVQNPNFEQLSLNGTVTILSARLNYLSAAMENKVSSAISHFYQSMWKRQQVNPLNIHNCGFDYVVKDRMNSFISDIQKDEYQTPPLIFD